MKLHLVISLGVLELPLIAIISRSTLTLDSKTCQGFNNDPNEFHTFEESF